MTTKKYLDLTGLRLFYSKLQEMFTGINDALSEVNSYLKFANSYRHSASLSAVDTNTRLHLINITTSQTLKLINGKGAGDVTDAGRDILIIIKNANSSNPITVTMPSSSVSTTKLLCESSYTIPVGKHIEVSIVSDGTNAYYRVAEQN